MITAKEFFGIPTGNICDSNGLIGAMDAGIMPLNYKMKMAGTALTVECELGDNLTIHKAIAIAQPGTVLVISCKGNTNCGVFGELFATSCVARGIVGVVIDGACRDKGDLIEMNFPVFSLGVNPNGTIKEICGNINVPIVCGGISVKPGDIIVGDSDGVVRIAKEDAQEVLSKAKEKQKKESQWKPLLAAGQTTVALLGFGEKLGI